jgi:acetolactate synthase-1/2/3 large subunit
MPGSSRVCRCVRAPRRPRAGRARGPERAHLWSILRVVARKPSSGTRARTPRAQAPKPRAAAAKPAPKRAGAATTKRAAARAKPAAARSGTKRTAQRGADVLVAQLESLGVEVAFGIPGVHNLAIFDALRRSRVRTVLVRHEQSAVYAADGYARATGRLAAAITTTGPGAANAAAAMGEARASRSPVLHISTQIETRLLAGRGGKWSLHESPTQREMMDAVSVWSGQVARADAIPTMLQRAAHEAFAGRRGPVFVEIPHDLLDAPVTWSARPPMPVRAPGVDERQLERAADVLRDAKRPAIWAGGGAVSAGAHEAIAKLAEALDAPVVTTYAGKGVLPREHPLLAGFPPHQPEITKLLAQSDALVVIGSDLDGMNTEGWRIPLPRPRVAINTMVEDARRNYAADVVIEADAAAALDALLPLVPPRKAATAARRVAAAREKADASLRASKEFAAPYAFVRALEDIVPARTVVACDMAIAGYWTAAYYRPRAPRELLYPLGWGTLGFALPAAVGAATSGVRALAVCGDAGALFAIGELATAAQENLPLAVLVVNDEGYGMLRYDERERFKTEFASDVRAPDFVALAKSFGIGARRATENDVGTALKWALGRTGPALVELRARWAPPLTTSPRWPLKGKAEARP